MNNSKDAYYFRRQAEYNLTCAKEYKEEAERLGKPDHIDEANQFIHFWAGEVARFEDDALDAQKKRLRDTKIAWCDAQVARIHSKGGA